MSTELSPDQRWAKLKEHILREIEAIDQATPWQDYEPKWWLEMQETRRQLNKSQKQ
jgi:hypothetical protein